MACSSSDARAPPCRLLRREGGSEGNTGGKHGDGSLELRCEQCSLDTGGGSGGRGIPEGDRMIIYGGIGGKYMGGHGRLLGTEPRERVVDLLVHGA